MIDRDDDPLRGWVDEDLADRLAGEERLDIDLVALGLAAAERGRTPLNVRLERALGRPVTVSLAGGEFSGVLDEVVDGAIVLLREGMQHLVRLEAVSWIVGVGPEGGADATRPRHRSMPMLLRAWAEEANPVRARLVDGSTWVGTVSAVGADHLDLLAPRDEGPPHPAVTRTVPFAAVAVVSRVR